MDPSWEFQAPQFVDFNNLERAEDKKADDFFNVDMESGELWTTAIEEAEANDIRQEDNVNNQPVALAAKLLPISDSTAGSTSSSLSVAKTSMQQKTRRLSNLVTSWSQDSGSKESSGKVGSVSSYTSSSSAAKPPAKKRRRMSNAIIQSLSLPSQTNNKLLRLTPKRHKASSITSYKSFSPKRLGTNTSEPRLAVNMWKKKGLLESNSNKTERPQSAPASASSKFFSISTIPKPFKLSTEKRAEERKIIDHRRKENEIRQEKMRKAELERRNRESVEELVRYRQSLIQKAQPIKQFRKTMIKRSEKMLTMPESPQLTRGTRVRRVGSV